jgi:predicted NUDIX family NTP pyrophosphohydrolase
MAKHSAGILLFRRRPTLEVFLAHPGGPFWADKDIGAWTIPKGMIEHEEEGLSAAVREFGEETGIQLEKDAEYLDLGHVKQKSGKIVHGWACEGEADPKTVSSNLIPVRWKGGWITVPEVDRCEWFDIQEAIIRINPAQSDFVLRLEQALR